MLYCLVRGYNSPEEYRFKRNLDFFELGYIEKDTPTILYVEKPKKIKKPKVEKPKKHPLFDDCCLALKALGYKTSQAKTVCVQIFSNNDITSIQQFIRIASNL
jgi:Holliday junction resolvasome RuvABC DNA-binding subunit